MFFSAALALSAFGLAQAATFDVIVGAGGLNYEPKSVNAAVGDTINFVFNVPKTNHTVTRSSFATPCVAATTPALVDSGYNAVVADDPTTFRNWSITLDSTDALWFYCAQGQHCKNGMVFAINPTAEKTFDMFLANAKNAAPASNSTGPASSGAPAPSGSASATGGSASASGSSSASAAGASGTAGSGNSAMSLSRSAAGVLAAVAGAAVFLL
jgi:plastocyanin